MRAYSNSAVGNESEGLRRNLPAVSSPFEEQARNGAKLDLKTICYPDLGALPESYAALFEEGASESFFLSRPWFQNYIETVVPPGTPVNIYGVETEQGSARGALLMQHTQPRGAMLAPTIMEGLANYYSPCFAPIISSHGDFRSIVAALAEGLWRDRGSWDVVKLQPVNQASPAFAALVDAFRTVGIVVQTFFCFGNWYLEVGGRTYQEYLGGLSSVLRKNIPYNIRRLEKSGHNRIEIVTQGDEVERALGDYEKIYSASWKIKEAYPGFVRGLVKTAKESGWLRMGMIYVNNEPAASQIWIVRGGIASIYKIAYDERFAKLSVGTALTAKLMQHVMDIDKVRIVDYLSGEDEYKRVWMSHRREFWGILALNPRSIRGLMQIGRHVGGSAAKKTVRKLFGWSRIH